MKPLLFLDIDGVLNRIGDNRPSRELDIPDGTAERVQRLLKHFDPVWATEWRERANVVWKPLLGLESDWPVLFYERSKYPRIHRYAGIRPFAWVEDFPTGRSTFAESCALVATKPSIGLTDDHVAQLIDFA